MGYEPRKLYATLLVPEPIFHSHFFPTDPGTEFISLSTHRASPSSPVLANSISHALAWVMTNTIFTVTCSGISSKTYCHCTGWPQMARLLHSSTKLQGHTPLEKSVTSLVSAPTRGIPLQRYAYLHILSHASIMFPTSASRPSLVLTFQRWGPSQSQWLHFTRTGVCSIFSRDAH